MKYKHVQAAHELRMWIVTIAAGVAATNALLARHPEVKETAHNAWDALKSKFKKTEEPKNTKTIKIVIINEGES